MIHLFYLFFFFRLTHMMYTCAPVKAWKIARWLASVTAALILFFIFFFFWIIGSILICIPACNDLFTRFLSSLSILTRDGQTSGKTRDQRTISVDSCLVTFHHYWTLCFDVFFRNKGPAKYQSHFVLKKKSSFAFYTFPKNRIL